MCLKIRCDGKSEKFCKIFWELNKALYIPLLNQPPGNGRPPRPITAGHPLPVRISGLMRASKSVVIIRFVVGAIDPCFEGSLVESLFG